MRAGGPSGHRAPEILVAYVLESSDGSNIDRIVRKGKREAERERDRDRDREQQQDCGIKRGIRMFCCPLSRVFCF